MQNGITDDEAVSIACEACNGDGVLDKRHGFEYGLVVCPCCNTGEELTIKEATTTQAESKQLICPECNCTNIEIRHKEQSFKCKDCNEGWAN